MDGNASNAKLFAGEDEDDKGDQILLGDADGDVVETGDSDCDASGDLDMEGVGESDATGDLTADSVGDADGD